MIKTPRTLNGVTFSVGSRDELEMVRALLSANSLPSEDIDEHIEHFFLAWDGRSLIAAAGVELLGTNGLLRSLCVDSNYRGRGLAAVLCERVEAYSRNAGVSRLYLLTTTAKKFFERRGFLPCSRESAPAEVQATAEFRSLCPSTAVCMVQVLDDGVLYLPKDLLPLREDVPGSRMWAIGLNRAMLTYFEVERHTRFDTHAHEGEQITTVVDGELFFALGEKVIRVAPGEAIAIPPRVPHAVFTETVRAKAFDAWSPPPPKYQRETAQTLVAVDPSAAAYPLPRS